ncbi:MAG TPA: hypothetical protein VGM16_11210 [Gammaproteobacteria bacterium]|jgi:hypothetical protein
MKPDSKRPNPASDVGLDEALAGTFPASDPVSPPSHVEEEKEKRRRVLEEDAANKRKDAAEEALDEGLRETFPASDPVAVHGRRTPDDAGRRADQKTTEKKDTAKRKP